MSLSDEEIRAVLSYIACNGVMETARYFRRHRCTIYLICKKYKVTPFKGKHGRKTKERSSRQLEEHWKKQDECGHGFYTIRCSLCSKILGSDSKKI